MTTRRKVVKAIREALTGEIKQLHSRLHRNLRATTPVDTGFARANWVPSVAQPFKGLAGTRAAAEQGTIDEGKAAGGAALVQAAGDLTRVDTWEVNNVDYIGDLNDGTSTKAPEMFVQNAIDDAVQRR